MYSISLSAMTPASSGFAKTKVSGTGDAGVELGIEDDGCAGVLDKGIFEEAAVLELSAGWWLLGWLLADEILSTKETLELEVSKSFDSADISDMLASGVDKFRMYV